MTVTLDREIVLDGWLGPTLFTPEPRDTLETYSVALAGHEHARSIVLGSTRETMDVARHAYAAYCAAPDGTVVSVDLAPPHRTLFVNSTIEAFAASLDAFASAWPDLGQVRSALMAIDSSALSDDDSFWPELLEGCSI